MALMPNDDDEQETPIGADGNPVGSLPDDDEDDVAPGTMNVDEQDDGSAVISFAGEKDRKQSSEFTENLADGIIPEDILNARAKELLDLIDQDLKAREKRDEQYAEGIKRTGLGNEAPGGAEFAGASKAVHPVLVEGCVDFAARAMKEICPPQGPVRTQIIGKATPQKLDKAERKRQHMNWQLTKQIPEYKPETEKMLTQVPMGGSQYKKWGYDHELGRPTVEAVFIDNLIIPFSASSFYTAERITHVQTITQATYERRIDCDFYRDLAISSSALSPDQSASEIASAKVEGKVDPGFNEDGERTVKEVSYYDRFEEDTCAKKKSKAPYIMHIDETSGKCLALYRNWEEGDKRQERLHWIVEYPFIPWRGAYGIGLPHMIGSLSGAITGSLRAILDNALAQTRLGGVKLKGGRNSGTTVAANPTEFTEVDSGVAGNQDDIRKVAMYAPINPMSPVLFQILDWMVNQAKGVVQVADEKLADVKSDMPVGTALALIEQGSVTFSQIHARMHYAQERELCILHRLNKWFLSDKEVIADLGDLVVSQEDYEGPVDVIPVSDPNIFSEAQRYAQMQAVLQTLDHPAFAQDPTVLAGVKKTAILARLWKLLNISNVEELVNAPKEPEDIDPVSENMVVALGEQPIKAFSHQDHLAHIKVHLAFITSPIFGANPMWGAKIVGPLMQNVFEHIVLYYTQHMYAASVTGKMLGVESKSMDDRFASVMHYADKGFSEEVNEEVGTMLKQAMQLAQQYAQQEQGQLPPEVQVQREIGMAEIKRKADYDKQDLQIKGQDSQTKAQLAKAQSDLDNARAQHDATMAQTEAGREHSREHNKIMVDAVTQHAKDQREQERIEAENRRAKDKLELEQRIAEMQDRTERALAFMREQILHRGDLSKHAATTAADVHNHNNKLKSEESRHAEQLASQERVADMQTTTERVTDLTGEDDIGKSLEKIGTMIADSQKKMGDTIATALKQQDLTRVIEQSQEAIEDLAEAVAQGHGDIQKSLAKVDKSVRAPRKRLIVKDKKGNKSAIDTIDDGK